MNQKQKIIYHLHDESVSYDLVQKLVKALGENNVESVYVFRTSKNIDVKIGGLIFCDRLQAAAKLGFELRSILAQDNKSFELSFNAEATA